MITTTAQQNPQIRKGKIGIFFSFVDRAADPCSVSVCLSVSFLICRLLSTYTHKRNRTFKLLLSSNLLLLPLLKTSAVREYWANWLRLQISMQTCYKERNQMISEQNRTERTYPAATRKTRPYINGFPLDTSTHTHTVGVTTVITTT